VSRKVLAARHQESHDNFAVVPHCETVTARWRARIQQRERYRLPPKSLICGDITGVGYR
jgi:hypothetical protein